MADKREKLTEEEIIKIGTSLEDLARKAGTTEEKLVKMLKTSEKLPKKLKEISKIKYKELTEETKKLSEQLDKVYRRQADGEKGLGTQVKALEKLKRKNIEQIEVFGKMKGSIGGLGDVVGMLSSKFPALGSALGALSGPLAILAFAVDHLKKVFDKWIEVQKNYVAATGAMQKTTGATAKQFDQITQAAAKMRKVFRDLEQDATGDKPSIEFIAELGMEYRNLNKAAGDMDFANAMLQVSRTTGLGTSETVAFHRAVEALDITSTTGEFMDLSQEINRFGEDMGVLPALVYKDFVKSKDSIARFGKEGVKVFKDVSRLANHFGIEADQIFKSMERFDTFGTASDEVNQFNAIMGTTLSSFEMMMDTDPTSRLEKIRNSVKLQGKSWNDLGYEQKKSLSQMLGLSEEQAARVIDSKMSIEDLRKAEKDAAQEAKKNDERKLTAQEEFTEALKRSSVVFEDMARAMEKNMIAQARATDSASRKINNLGVKAINSTTKKIEEQGDVTKQWSKDWDVGIEIIGESLSKFADKYSKFSKQFDTDVKNGIIIMRDWWDGATNSVENFGNKMVATWDTFSTFWSAGAEKIGANFSEIYKNYIGTYVDKLMEKISSISEVLKNSFVSAFDTIRSKVVLFVDPILNLISKLETFAKTVGLNLSNQTRSVAASMTDVAYSGASAAVNPIANGIGSIGSYIGNTFSELGQAAVDQVSLTESYNKQNALRNSSVVSNSAKKTQHIVSKPQGELRVITSDINMDGKKVGEAHVQVALGR